MVCISLKKQLLYVYLFAKIKDSLQTHFFLFLLNADVAAAFIWFRSKQGLQLVTIQKEK